MIRLLGIRQVKMKLSKISLDVDLQEFEIGKIYQRNEKPCIFDPIREILVVITPEEIIRQKFIQYLIHRLKVPKEMIFVEVPMTIFKKGARDRADIIIVGRDDEGNSYSMMVVECKAAAVPLVDDVWDQVLRYDKVVQSGLVVITNGELTFSAALNQSVGHYAPLEKMLTYPEMLEKKDYPFYQDNGEKWTRPDFEMLMLPETIDNFKNWGNIGDDTPERLYPFIINLAGFLLDQTLKFSPYQWDDLKVVDDGIRFTTFGNAAGGDWTNEFHYFMIEDESGENQIVSITVQGSMHFENDPRFGNRKGVTTLVVAVDDYDKRHNSLQLCMDRYTICQNDRYLLWHDGTLTVGKKGSAKKDEVIRFIQTQEPSLIDQQGRVFLGSFDANAPISFEQPETRLFIRNVIRYAVVRDQFRRLKNESA